MTKTPSDQSNSNLAGRAFSRILARNVMLPLALGATLSIVFIGMIFHLITVSAWVDHTDQVIAKTNHVARIVSEAQAGVRGYLLTGDAAFLEPHETARHEIGVVLNEVRALVDDNASQLARINRISVAIEGWQAVAREQVARKNKNQYTQGYGAAAGNVRMNDVRREFDKFLEVEHGLRSQRIDTTKQMARWLVATVAAFSLLSGAFLALVGRRQLLKLSKDYEDALRAQRDQNQTLEREAWVQAGAADITELLRGELASAVVAERALDGLVPYVNAVVGAVYASSDDGKNYVRLAGHASSAQESERVRPREGLLGQAIETGKMLTLRNLPEDYVKIESGLTSARPTHLCIVPLIADGKVVAALELGFLIEPGEETVDLLERVAENIGVALKSAAYRLRLQDLLEESQRMNEELQSQQEELKTTNEELREQTQALQEAQMRMQSQHTELEQYNQQLEEQARQLESQRQDLDQQNQDLKQARETIEGKARELAEANRYKSEFLANMSHELRTPLNSSLILAKLLKDNPMRNLTEEQVEFASTIYASGNDLLTLINDILDLSKVEAGKLDIRAETFDFTQLRKSLEDIFKPVASEKKLRFEVEIDESVGSSIETDRLRLEQILKNLLSNAFKFTSRGSVKLRITHKAGDQVVFTVSDTGIGIAPEKQRTIFEAFRQADGTTSRIYGGTGLGLTISRNLAHLLGGSISVTSALGKGSDFSLVLPKRATTTFADEADRAKEHQEKRVFRDRLGTDATLFLQPTSPISDDRATLERGTRSLLIVEDDPGFTKTLSDLAREQGFKVLIASNTAEGQQLAHHFLPCAIVLDLKLPDGPGLSLLEQLKTDPKTRHIPAHAISAIDYSYDLKPKDREQLKQTLQNLERRISQKIKRVLVVEDDERQRDSIQKLIGEKDVEISSVGTATGALEKLKGSPFDCMIVDLALPDMSGFELLERLEQGSELAHPPVIVYTGKSLSSEEEERLGRYSRSIIIKGERSPERLLDEVTLFLHQVDSHMAPEKQTILRSSRNREKAFEERTILLVDDDVRNIFALRSVLQQKGADVIVARNGREALERLSEAPRIDLVLMDIMMPVMDGHEAMRRIRSQSKWDKLPIIAVTAKAMKDDYESCLAAGASDYLTKPVDVDKLVSLMRVWLPPHLGVAAWR